MFWPMKKWESMLLGHHFHAFTDHHNILQLAKSAVPKLVRWRLQMQQGSNFGVCTTPAAKFGYFTHKQKNGQGKSRYPCSIQEGKSVGAGRTGRAQKLTRKHTSTSTQLSTSTRQHKHDEHRHTGTSTRAQAHEHKHTSTSTRSSASISPESCARSNRYGRRKTQTRSMLAIFRTYLVCAEIGRCQSIRPKFKPTIDRVGARTSPESEL